MRNRQRARCTRCGHIAPLRAFEVEVALSADDSGDNDWVINFACPACEAADRPQILAEATADGASSRQAPGHSANPMYDPRMP
jgi:hypothetical protein